MLKKVSKFLLQLVLASVLGVVLVYSSMRLFGLSLSFPKEYESLEIASDVKTIDTSPFIQPMGKQVRNVILFNIAGMGINQLLATRYRYYGKQGRLCMERMPVVALVNNSPLGSNLVSSPHAAATALATGEKAFNGKISPPGSQVYTTLLQKFQQVGAQTGIITNSYITGATTAAFGSNVESRRQQREIAMQMLTGKIDLMVGGGNEFYKGGYGTENVTGEEYATSQGYTVVKDKLQLLNTKDSLILGLFDGMYSDRYNSNVSFDPRNPTFQELIPFAVEHLSRKGEGFFLLVDDEGTDFGGYRNRADYLTQHLIAMDNAICEAVAFAQEDGKTLVIVTSEAEAGGMVITGGDSEEGVMNFAWGSTQHTGQMVPLLSYGPGAYLFTGVIENTDVHHKIVSLLQSE